MRDYPSSAKVDRQNRVTIPKAIRDKEKVKPGDVIEVIFRFRRENESSENPHEALTALT